MVPHLDPVDGKDIATDAYLSLFPEKGFLMPGSLEAELAPANLPPRPNAARDGGRLAVSSHLQLAVPEADLPAGFIVEEAVVLSVISEGHTMNQAARHLYMDKDEVKAHRGSAMAKFGTRSIAYAVHKAVRCGLVLIEAAPDSGIIDGLYGTDERMLNLYARGFSNHHFARTSGKPVKLLEEYHDGLLERLGVWSRPHAVRRGHELEIIS